MSIEETNECIICFDHIDINQNIQIFKDCEHNNFYHNECMNNWIKNSINKNLIPSCPICCNQIKVTEIIKTSQNPEIIKTSQNSEILFVYHFKYFCCLSGIIAIVLALTFCNYNKK